MDAILYNFWYIKTNFNKHFNLMLLNFYKFQSISCSQLFITHLATAVFFIITTSLGHSVALFSFLPLQSIMPIYCSPDLQFILYFPLGKLGNSFNYTTHELVPSSNFTNFNFSICFNYYSSIEGPGKG